MPQESGEITDSCGIRFMLSIILSCIVVSLLLVPVVKNGQEHC